MPIFGSVGACAPEPQYRSSVYQVSRERTLGYCGVIFITIHVASSNNGFGVMIITQENIFPAYPPSAPERNPSGFAETRAAVEKDVREFGKPVVLVHGDTHYFSG